VSKGVELIACKGYSGASIDDIVSAAGVSKGAFYYHFQSKEEFVISIVEQRARDNLIRFQETHQGEISLAEWIESSFSMIIRLPEANADLALFSLEVMVAGIHGQHEAIGKVGRWIHETWRKVLSDMIRESKEFQNGEIHCDPDLIAVGIMAMVDGLLIHSRIEPETFAGERFVERLAPMLQHWIAS